MRESTFVLLFLPLFIVAFFPWLFNAALSVPASVVLQLVRYSASSIYRKLPNNNNNTPTSATSPCPPPSETHHHHHHHSGPSMSWFQKTLTLPSRARGSYLITDEITSQVPEIGQYRVGVLHLFLQHTSAALSLNENWDDDVRADMSDALDRIVPEDTSKRGELYRHAAEGKDDMPAHVKSALVGASVSVPITDGRLNTGTWQGIWFLEFRVARHSRKVVATIQGERM